MTPEQQNTVPAQASTNKISLKEAYPVLSSVLTIYLISVFVLLVTITVVYMVSICSFVLPGGFITLTSFMYIYLFPITLILIPLALIILGIINRYRLHRKLLGIPPVIVLSIMALSLTALTSIFTIFGVTTGCDHIQDISTVVPSINNFDSYL